MYGSKGQTGTRDADASRVPRYVSFFSFLLFLFYLHFAMMMKGHANTPQHIERAAAMAPATATAPATAPAPAPAPASMFFFSTYFFLLFTNDIYNY